MYVLPLVHSGQITDAAPKSRAPFLTNGATPGSPNKIFCPPSVCGLSQSKANGHPRGNTIDLRKPPALSEYHVDNVRSPSGTFRANNGRRSKKIGRASCRERG